SEPKHDLPVIGSGVYFKSDVLVHAATEAGHIIIDEKRVCKFIVKTEKKSSTNAQESNKVNRHFHCMHPGCGYSFVRYSTMAVHEQKHQADNITETSLKTQNTQHNICTSPSLQDMKKIQEEAGSPMSTRSESIELNSATPLSGNSPSQLRPPFVLRTSSPESLTSKT
ncbi:unnamed protein product, partial [Timema podura]|nr:unnamed protein product [Timema podura]